MSFEHHDGRVIGTHQLEELKLVYRVLHAHLAEHTELMDTDFLIELQGFLQQQAHAQGVDVGHHAAWDAWLGHDGVPDCDMRLRNRGCIEPRRAR